MAEVLVLGAGPVGLTLAGELARHGARCRIVDRLPRPSPYCRAIGVTPRTLEVWEDMGVAREMIDAGLWLRGLRSIVHGRPPLDTAVDLSFLPYAQLGLPQYETERVLARHLGRFGVAVERGPQLRPGRRRLVGLRLGRVRRGLLLGRSRLGVPGVGGLARPRAPVGGELLDEPVDLVLAVADRGVLELRLADDPDHRCGLGAAGPRRRDGVEVPVDGLRVVAVEGSLERRRAHRVLLHV
jgi:hypothetical protein